jgi:uncharacterized protein YkwD
MKNRFALIFLVGILILNVFFVSIESNLGSEVFPNIPPYFFDHGDYSSDEQYMLELHNRARKDPIAESTRLEIDLQDGIEVNLTSMPPLAMNRELCITADEYSEIMYDYGTLGHSVDGTQWWDRIADNNYTGSPVGEIVANFVSYDHLYQMVMGSVNHRKFVLGLPSYSNEFGTGSYNNYANMIYCKSNITYVLGVVYNDTNENSFYDVGEGLENVYILPNRGDYYTITGTSGGYSLPISINGTLEIHAFGLIAGIYIKKSLSVSSIGDNIKLDFLANETSPLTVPTTTSTSTEDIFTTWLTHTTWVTNTKETVDFISLSIISIACIVYVIRRKQK